MPKPTEGNISLSNIFGKVSSVVATAAGCVTYWQLGTLIVGVTDTAQQYGVNPADHMIPTLAGLGVCLGAGFLGMYLGNLKERLTNEFNHNVRADFESMGFELEIDESGEAKAKEIPEREYYRPRYRDPYYHNSGFWDGYIIASMFNRGHSHSSSSHSSSSRSSSSSSSSSSGKGGQGMAYAIAIGVAVAAAAASAYISYASLKKNFGKSTKLLYVNDAPAQLEPNVS